MKCYACGKLVSPTSEDTEDLEFNAYRAIFLATAQLRTADP